MLVLNGLSAGYGSATVLHGIDLRVDAGDIVALIGANGAGKSTLMKTISGLLATRSGQIEFEGRRIEKLSSRGRVRLGIVQVPEGRQIFAGLTVAENLQLGTYSVRHEMNEAEFARRIERVCALFPILRERYREPVGNLSGGQQQMLVIARGMMAKPRLLLLDEPSLGLAPILVSEIFRLIASLRSEGLAILLAEQNARMSLAIADRAYVIEQGKVTLEGLGKELIGRSEVAERYLGVGRAVASLDADHHRQLVDRLRAIFRG